MFKQSKQAFTLVELIVVITILAILGTIAFIALQGYSASARDSRRISDVQNIKKSLEFFSLNAGKYPLPDNGNEALYETKLIWTQGIIGNIVQSNLSRNLNEKPLDPLTQTEYTYSVTRLKKEYELLSVYESDLVSYNNLLNQTQAKTLYPKIDGTYNQIFVVTPEYIVPTPSIVNAEMASTGITLNDTNIQSQITTGGSNIIDYGTTTATTGGLPYFTLEAYTGSLSSLTLDTGEPDTGAMLDLADSLQTAYSGSLLAEEDIYQPIVLAITEEEQLALIDEVVFHEVNAENNPDVIITDWRSIDSNCDLPDVIIGDQTWAGCNSTLGTGMEFVSTHSYSCRNYDMTYEIACSDLENLSTSKANAWFTGTTIYGDSEVNNIWGKLYYWLDASKTDGTGPCREGYHLPSDQEWSILEQYLGCLVSEENRTSRGCSGLGWKGYLEEGKDSTNNIVQALKLPIAGYRINDVVTFHSRGRNTTLWSSTSYDTNSAWNRKFERKFSEIRRQIQNKTNYAFSVRCLKD